MPSSLIKWKAALRLAHFVGSLRAFSLALACHERAFGSPPGKRKASRMAERVGVFPRIIAGIRAFSHLLALSANSSDVSRFRPSSSAFVQLRQIAFLADKMPHGMSHTGDVPGGVAAGFASIPTRTENGNGAFDDRQP